MAAASAGGQAVENQLKIGGFKRNVDVLALYLAGQGLRIIPSLSRFHRLRYLWINNNKIQDLSFLIKNYCLTELYLNNNELTDISGALKHLCVLQILLLHNNQLKKLDKTVKELEGMMSLQTLNYGFLESKNKYMLDNLFHNPLAEDRDYRLYVIHCLPSVQLLDRKLVTQKERESALHHCNHERSHLMHSIAFGKRVKTSLETTAGSSRCTQPARRLIMPSGIYHNVVNLEITQIGTHFEYSSLQHSYFLFKMNSYLLLVELAERIERTDAQRPLHLMLVKWKIVPWFALGVCCYNYIFMKVPLENPEDAVSLRAMARSLMEFSSVDWNKVPTCRERRLENKAEEPREKLTIQFR